MFSKRRVVISSTASILLLCLLAYVTSFTVMGKVAPSQSSADPQMLQSLLSEVRELRLALQRSNLTTFRTQVALERLRLQMGRVESLRESLERTREELANERSTRLGMADQLKELEDRISAEKGAAKRESLITEQTELKTALNQASFREEQQREKENRLSSELQVEQTKLDEMSNKLETMERKLEAQWPEEGPRQNRRQ